MRSSELDSLAFLAIQQGWAGQRQVRADGSTHGRKYLCMRVMIEDINYLREVLKFKTHGNLLASLSSILIGPGKEIENDNLSLPYLGINWRTEE